MRTNFGIVLLLIIGALGGILGDRIYMESTSEADNLPAVFNSESSSYPNHPGEDYNHNLSSSGIDVFDYPLSIDGEPTNETRVRTTTNDEVLTDTTYFLQNRHSFGLGFEPCMYMSDGTRIGWQNFVNDIMFTERTTQRPVDDRSSNLVKVAYPSDTVRIKHITKTTNN